MMLQNLRHQNNPKRSAELLPDSRKFADPDKSAAFVKDNALLIEVGNLRNDGADVHLFCRRTDGVQTRGTNPAAPNLRRKKTAELCGLLKRRERVVRREKTKSDNRALSAVTA